MLHEHATLVLERLAWENEQRREAIAAADAVAALERELLSGSEAAQQAAAAVFVGLSLSKADSLAFKAVAAAASTLARCLASSSEVIAPVLDALGSLVYGDPQVGEALLSGGFLPSVRCCLQSSSIHVAAEAAWLIDNLAHKLPAARQAISAAGIDDALVGLLQRCEGTREATAASWALHSLANDCPASQQAILAAGGFDVLLCSFKRSTARSIDVTHRGATVVALCTLAQGSEQLRQAARAAGAAATLRQSIAAWQADESSNKLVAAKQALNFLCSSQQAITPGQVEWLMGCAFHSRRREPTMCVQLTQLGCRCVLSPQRLQAG